MQSLVIVLALLWIPNSAAESPLIELAGAEAHNVLCDSRVWKSIKDHPRFIDSIARSWCNATYQDAIHHAMLSSEELRECYAGLSRLQSGWTQCTLDMNATMVEVQMEFAKIQQVVAAKEEELRAQIAYWKEKCHERISIADCSVQKQEVMLQCQVIDVQPPSAGHDQAAIKTLDEELSLCRLEKAFVSAETDHTITKLRKQVRLLNRLLTACGTLMFGILVAAVFMQGSRTEASEDPSGYRNVEAARVLTLTSRETLRELTCMFDRGSRIRPLLTSVVSQGQDVFLLLVPFNSSRERRFSLFGVGGDYTHDLQSARESSGNCMLYVVLYDYIRGGAFSESVLSSLGLEPAEICRKAVPRDVADLEVLVFCSGPELINRDGVRVLEDSIIEEDWARYLGGRHGLRVG